MSKKAQNKDKTEKKSATETVEEKEAVVEEVQEEVKEEEPTLEEQLAEQKDKFIRLYSEFENYRRRTAKETYEIRMNASESLIKELLPVLDDFERASKSFDTATEMEPIKEGVKLIYEKFQKTLASKGLKVMDTDEKIFDAELHECVTQFDAGEEKKGKVIDTIEKGYHLNEKVIRYAKVVVGS